MSDAAVDQGRRTWIAITCGAGAVGGAAVAVPFVSTFAPSERAKAAGAPVQVDISGLRPGEKLTVEWRGKPVWIVRRTPEQLESLKKTEAQLADPNSSAPRTRRRSTREPAPLDQARVLVGRRHLLAPGLLAGRQVRPGAQPSLPDDWAGGFFCPCHGSTFDMAGRVFKNKPAPDNLEVPPHMYLSDTRLLIGEDKQGLSGRRSIGLTEDFDMAEFKEAPAGASRRRRS
jgi:ubiquinol-cytochrome c reductase iron-sulfur subunit